MSTLVGHWKLDRCDVYVGRGSRWGNPYATAATAARSKYTCIPVADPVREFELYLQRSPELMRQLPALKGKVLGCYCRRVNDPASLPSTERCHGEILARYADRDVVMVPARHAMTQQAPASLVVREILDARWVAPADFDRQKHAPPHPVYDGRPTMTLAEFMRGRR